MSSYLKNRKQYVVFNNKQSDYSEVYTGVPQGSILGPLFFSICINDLIIASDRLKFLMYADDTTTVNTKTREHGSQSSRKIKRREPLWLPYHLGEQNSI